MAPCILGIFLKIIAIFFESHALCYKLCGAGNLADIYIYCRNLGKKLPLLILSLPFIVIPFTLAFTILLIIGSAIKLFSPYTSNFNIY